MPFSFSFPEDRSLRRQHSNDMNPNDMADVDKKARAWLLERWVRFEQTEEVESTPVPWLSECAVSFEELCNGPRNRPTRAALQAMSGPTGLADIRVGNRHACVHENR